MFVELSLLVERTSEIEPKARIVERNGTKTFIDETHMGKNVERWNLVENSINQFNR